MNFLCKCLGGSHMYGLEGPDSDIDQRGIFYNQDINNIIGLDRYEHQNLKSETDDCFYWEIRHYLNSLRKTNTQSIELLFNEDWELIHTIVLHMQKNKEKLINTEYLYSSLVGYMGGEVRLANGERQGDIGKKRRNAVEKYGFSPKNWVNLIRLAYCGAYFYEHGMYPVKVRKYLPDLVTELYDIKNNPQNYKLEYLQSRYLECKQILDESYANTKIHWHFDKDYANDILIYVYGHIIKGKYDNLKFS